jgi:hypothetical protein
VAEKQKKKRDLLHGSNSQKGFIIFLYREISISSQAHFINQTKRKPCSKSWGAGKAIPGPSLELPEHERDRVTDANLKGYDLCAQAVRRKMVERKKGIIDCVASRYASKGLAGWVPAALPRPGLHC